MISARGRFLRSFANPGSDSVVACTGGDNRLEVLEINLGELQPHLIERAIGVIFALPFHKAGAAFVQRAGGQHVNRLTSPADFVDIACPRADRG